jgi:hypothetical protein
MRRSITPNPRLDTQQGSDVLTGAAHPGQGKPCARREAEARPDRRLTCGEMVGQENHCRLDLLRDPDYINLAKLPSRYADFPRGGQQSVIRHRRGGPCK